MRIIKKAIAILMAAMLLLSMTSVGMFATGGSSSDIRVTNISYNNYDTATAGAGSGGIYGTAAPGYALNSVRGRLDGGEMVSLADTAAYAEGIHPYAVKIKQATAPFGYWYGEHNYSNDVLDTAGVGKYSMSGDFWIPTGMMITTKMTITDTASKSLGTVILGTTGTVEVKSDAAETVGTGTYALDTWNKFEITMNPASKGIEIAIGDTVIASYTYSVEGATGKIGNINISRLEGVTGATDDNSYIYMDNLSFDRIDVVFDVLSLDFVTSSTTNISYNNYDTATAGAGSGGIYGTAASGYALNSVRGRLDGGEMVSLANTAAYAGGIHPYAVKIKQATAPFGYWYGEHNYSNDVLDTAGVGKYSMSGDFWIPTGMMITTKMTITDTASKSLGTVILGTTGTVEVKSDAAETVGTGTYALDSWNKFEITVNPASKGVEIAIGDTVIASYTYSVEGATGKIGNINISRPNGVEGATDDNSYIYMDNLSFDRIDTGKPCNVEVSVKNETGATRTIEILMASYDAGGMMTNVKRETKAITAGTNTYGLNAGFEAKADTDEVKAFVWDSLTNLKPLINEISE